MNQLLIGCAAALLAVAAVPATGQGAPPPPPGVAQGTAPALPPRQMQPPMRMRPMGDRTMTRDEVVRHVRALFSRLDTNHDGFVTKDEVEALHGRMTMPMALGKRRDMRGHGMDMGMSMADPAAMFDRLDANHDGVISRQEFIAAHSRMREHRSAMMHGNAMGMAEHMFEMSDLNHDGRVSLEEAQAAALARFDRADLNHDGKLTPEERREARR